jgi:pimeloyl-ACP methyl ester carboxylesterase
MNTSVGVVFIYGAGLGDFIWTSLKPLINYPILTIEFPNREGRDKSNADLTFADYQQSAIEQIQKWGEKSFVIVTHSIGGCIGLSLTDFFAEKVVGFVGISSAVPKNGDSFISCLPFPQRLLMPLLLRLLGTKPPQKSIEQEYCNDLTQEQCSEIVRRFTPEAKELYTTKVIYKNLTIKTLFIKLTNDKSFTISLQDQMAANLNAKEKATLNSGHLPMISKPKELAEIVNKFLETIT